MEAEIIKIIKKIKGENFSVTENLITDGHINSFDFLQLIFCLERSFDIKIPLEKIEPQSFNSVDKICDFINNQSK